MFESVLDLTKYESARRLIVGLSPLYGYFAVIAIAALFWAAWRWPQRRQQRLVVVILMGLWSWLAVIIWFHAVIYESFVLINPLTGAHLVRPLIPIWIESEKLFFWLLCFTTTLSFTLRRPGNPKVSRACLTILAALLAVSIWQNPFSEPLPRFHRELIMITQGLRSGDHALWQQSFESALGSWKYYYGSAFMWIHPPLLFISYGVFLAGFIANVLMLWIHDRDIEQAGTAAIKFGYLVLSVGMLVGYPWAATAWQGSPWWWSPKINVSIMMWVLYTAYLHSRLHLVRRGMWTTTSALGILSFLVLAFNYISTYLIPGIHSYG